MIVTAASGFVVLLSLAVVQTQDDWSVTYRPMSICAPEGSTVEMPCRYTYPSTWNSVSISVEKRFWTVKKNKNNQDVDLSSDPEYSGRVKYLPGQNVCTLQIKNLRKTDSAEYKFRFTTNHKDGSWTGSPGVTLTVTALQVKVVSSTSNSSHTYVSLRCHSECNPPYSSFVWFNNGQKIHTGIYYKRWINPGFEIWCTLKGFEDYRSASVYAPKLPLVSVSPSGDITEGRSMNLTCVSDANPAATYTWYKKNEKVLNASGPVWTITEIRPEHSGNYYCEARNIFGNQTSTVSLNFGSGSLPKADVIKRAVISLTAVLLVAALLLLICCIWRKRMSKKQSEAGKKPDNKSQLVEDPEYENTSVAAQRSPAEQQHDVFYASVRFTKNQADALYSNTTAAQPRPQRQDEETMEYSTINISRGWPVLSSASAQHAQSLSPGAQLLQSSVPLDVHYAPKSSLVSVSPSGDVIEGRLVTLTCDSDAKPAATYTWYKNQNQLQGAKRTYCFSSIKSGDIGSYTCRAQNQFGEKKSAPVFLNVQYAPKSSSVSVSPPGDITEGRSVNLTCVSDANPAATYTWYKKNENVLNASGPVWTITEIRPEHSGDYYCEARNIFGSQTSTVSLNIKSGSMTAANMVRMSAVVLGAVLLPGVFWTQRKKMSKQQSDGGKRPNEKSQLSVSSGRQAAVDPDYENTSAAAQSSDDGLYVNTRAVELLRRHEDESAV
ncbi:B-cell receptor CD22-like [Thalassophryne amazonica]|uniref:B-cell receptor CD22-like n=1 Tax=Thalassophryne amazonica TaxID=390379 RepID=UPI00147089DF|nr:B-cell receptor CD22-like [Thalassophryne amazonica]